MNPSSHEGWERLKAPASVSQLVNALCKFDALGIQFVSLDERVDTSTPNGRLVFGIFASIAEFKCELIRERARAGLLAEILSFAHW